MTSKNATKRSEELSPTQNDARIAYQGLEVGSYTYSLQTPAVNLLYPLSPSLTQEMNRIACGPWSIKNNLLRQFTLIHFVGLSILASLNIKSAERSISISYSYPTATWYVNAGKRTGGMGLYTFRISETRTGVEIDCDPQGSISRNTWLRISQELRAKADVISLQVGGLKNLQFIMK